MCCGSRKLSRNFSKQLSHRVRAVFHGEHRYLITRVAGQFGITVSAALQSNGFIQVNDLVWGIYHDWPLMAGQGSERDVLNPAWPCEIFSRQRQLGTPHGLLTLLGTSPATGSVRHRHQHALCIAVLAS